MSFKTRATAVHGYQPQATGLPGRIPRSALAEGENGIMSRSTDAEASSWASSPSARKTMMGNRRRDTIPEIAVRRMLHSRGLRYRVDYAPPATPRRRADIVFTGQKIAVFIDGCFWHGCPEHYIAPVENAAFWADKVLRNRTRDSETVLLLEKAGWVAMRFWEHDDVNLVADRVEDAVKRRDH